MIRVDEFLFGYVLYTLEPEDVAEAARIFLKNDISVRIKDSRFAVSARKTSKIDALLGTRVKFKKSEILGFGGFIYRNRKRYGAFGAFLLCAAMLIFSSDRVWDIRIEGSYLANESEILEELSECGFSAGSSWSNTDINKLEVELLSKSEYVSWVNINRRGTVAYVTVVDKITHDKPDEKLGYANIVASCDAIIEEITVMSGVAVVKAGDSVKKGDLLISGVIPSELGGGLCYAEGVIIGRCSESVEVSVPSVRQEKVSGKPKLSGSKLKIFGFSVNIFKSYRNLGKECDIIDVSKNPTILGARLPISLKNKYSVPYSYVEVTLGAEDMTKEAAELMESALADALSGATLVRISTDGEFSDSSYTMKSSIVCLRQIGVDLPFGVS